MNQTIKNYIGYVAMAAIVVLGYAALSYVHTYSKTVEPSSFRSFSVTGEGRVVAIPDVAQFTFSVLTQGGTDLAALQNQNTQKMNAAITFVKNQGVHDKDVKTENYSVSPRYQSFSCRQAVPLVYPGSATPEPIPCPPSEIVGYTISQTASVKIRDFDTIGGLLSGVLESGANSVSQLYFTLDDPTEIENRARTEAIQKAQKQAEAIADAADFRLGKLLSIDEGFYYPYGRGGVEQSISFDGAARAPAPSIEPGSQEIVVNVNLRYEIE